MTELSSGQRPGRGRDSQVAVQMLRALLLFVAGVFFLSPLRPP